MADWKRIFLAVLWEGGSSYDAWLNIASTRIAQLLVLFPHSWSQSGLPSAIIFHAVFICMGYWTVCCIHILYLKYRSVQDLHPVENHSIQLHDVLGGLLGKRWRTVSLISSLVNLLFITTVELIACSNIIYLIDENLPKRTWTLITGAICSSAILMPSAQNYRAWSFIGVISTVYISCYMAIAALIHGEVPNIQRPLAPPSFRDYFSALQTYIASGSGMIPVEIMHAMWKPKEFRTSWFYGTVYVIIIAMPTTLIVFWMFGKQTLSNMNALALLPRSKFRQAAVGLLVLHQYILIGIFLLPMFLICEKMFGVHKSPSFIKRTLVRVPVFLFIWFIALAFPFVSFSTPVAIFTTWALYIVPCSAYMCTFWRQAQLGSNKEERPFSNLSWEVVFSVNLGITLWMLIMNILGTYATVLNFVAEAGNT